MNSPTVRLREALADRYRLERELGQGGMATVYLAHDIKHDRQVAIKVLRPELAAVIGAERFLSEIKTTANLQHPHILPLHDSGQADSFLFYVMPFVAGESLRDRLTREKQLPVGDAVRIATEVAGALDYAHRQGIIHRDIKPENILLHDGRALVADFGIALAATSAGSRMTETGMSLGTPHYMSPEQAMGDRELTPRSDVYALGAMTYEMLLGEPPFTGPTAQSIVAKVMTEKPAPILGRRDRVPPAVEDAVLQALEKLPADRFATAAEFAVALGGGGTTSAARAARRAPQPIATWVRDPRSLAALGALLLVSALALTARMGRTGAATGADAPPMLGRLALAPEERIAGSLGDEGSNAGRPSRTAFAFSPDGEAVVFVGARDNVPQLFLRALAAETSTPIAGTEGAESPFFAPDGRSIGYWANGKLMRVPPSGGLPTEITAIARITGASWTDDDRIVVGTLAGLVMLFPTGAAPPDTVAAGGTMPQFLPGGKALLFTSRSQLSASGYRIELLTMATRSRATLIENGSDARYVPTGHVVFARGGAMLAAPFDPERRALTASPAVVLPDVMVAVNGNNVSAQSGAMQVAISPLGHLLYLTGGPTPDRSRQLVSIDRSGRSTPITGAGMRPFFAVRLSPEGGHLAATLVGLNPALYVYDLARQVGQVITDPGRQLWPLWSSDGTRIVRSGLLGDSAGLVWGPFDGSRGAEALVPGKFIQGGPVFWSPDGTELVTQQGTTGGMVVVSLADGAMRRLENLPDSASYLDLSPDGKWVVYGAPEAGSSGFGFQIFVQPWPALDRKWKISTNGGIAPRWTRNGHEIVYLRGMGTDSAGQTISQVMSVAVTSSAGFASEPPLPLFSAAFGTQTTPLRSYDVTADGTRFFVIAGARTYARPGELHLLVNWFSTLRRLEALQGGP